MTDDVKLSFDSTEVEIEATKVTYTLNKKYLVDLKMPNLDDGPEERLIMDTKEIDRAVSIQGHLVGPSSTDDIETLMSFAYLSDGEPITLNWRSLTFTDCWVKSINVTDTMSISGTIVNGTSQTFDSDQILDDTITFNVSVMLIRGEKL